MVGRDTSQVSRKGGRDGRTARTEKGLLLEVFPHYGAPIAVRGETDNRGEDSSGGEGRSFRQQYQDDRRYYQSADSQGCGCGGGMDRGHSGQGVVLVADTTEAVVVLQCEV